MRPLNSTRLIASLIASAAVPSLSMALPPTDPFTQLQWYGDTPWTGTNPPGAFVRATAGDFNADGAKDVFLLVDGEPAFFYSPASWDALNVNADVGEEYVNDIATLPRADGTGDDLVYVDEDGLHRVAWTPGFSATQLSVEGSLWATDPSWRGATKGATRLRTGDLDGNGYVDCVGIKEGGRTILVRHVELVNGVEVGHTTSFTFQWDVYDIDIVQWNGGTDREIAIVDDFGIEVFTPAGDRINRYPRPTNQDAGDAIAVFRKSGYDYDRIVWARRRASPNNSEQELVELAWTLPLQYSLPTDIHFQNRDHVTALVAVNAHQVDGYPDGNDELMVQHEASHDPIIFKGIQGPEGEEAETATFSDSEQQTIEDNVETDRLYTPASSAAGYSGMPAPVFEDLSGDGVPDVFLHVQDGSDSFFQYWRGLPYEPEQLYEGAVTRLKIHKASVPSGGGTPNYDPVLEDPPSGQQIVADVTGEMHLILNVPFHQDANRLEIVVWKRSAGSATEPLAYDEEFHRLLFRLPDETNPPADWNGTTPFDVKVPMNFILNGSGPDYDMCQTVFIDNQYREKEFWLGIHLANYDPQANPDTLQQVGEAFVMVFSATHENGNDLFIPGFSDNRQICVCDFPRCYSDTLPNDALCTECSSQLGVIILSGVDTPRRRFAPTENRLRPAPPSSWVDIL